MPMCAAGAADGEYALGGQTVTVKDGKALLADGTIAASTTNLWDEFQNVLRFGVPFRQALKSVTINPARAIRARSGYRFPYRRQIRRPDRGGRRRPPAPGDGQGTDKAAQLIPLPHPVPVFSVFFSIPLLRDHPSLVYLMVSVLVLAAPFRERESTIRGNRGAHICL